MHFETSAMQILKSNPKVLAVEKTNLTEERGNYVVICEKSNERETKEFIDKALEYLNKNAQQAIQHPTHPEIRRSSPNRWSTQLREYAESMTKVQDQEKLPSKPPNAWNKKSILINNLEDFPKLPTRKSPKNPSAKNPENANDLEEKLREIEERMNKEFEEKDKKLEQKCTDLENSLSRAMQMVERLEIAFDRA